MLELDPQLRRKYDELVGGGLIDDSEFWSNVTTTSKSSSMQHASSSSFPTGLPSAIMSVLQSDDAKLEQDDSDDETANSNANKDVGGGGRVLRITARKKLALFSLYPELKVKYILFYDF